MTFDDKTMRISTEDIIARSWERTGVVGHRGAAAYKPENTLPAFEEGIASGADAVECDVHTSLDGEVVVIHDDTLDRTTVLKGPVPEATSQSLTAAGVPLLSDLTHLTKDRVVLVIEIKDGEEIDRKVVDHLREREMIGQSIVFSFGAGHIQNVKELAPDLYAVWLLGQWVDGQSLGPIFDRLAEMKADAVGTDYRNCPPELVAEAHRRRMPVFVWTVPPGPQVDRLKALMANFIITNHPRDVLRQLSA